ncbi:hypothetical protein BH18ACT6_BH18ACT6_11150 [soil metagenome]
MVYANDADCSNTGVVDPRRDEGGVRRRGISRWIVYEFLRVVTHPRVLRIPFDGPGAHSFLGAVLASASVHILTETARHLDVLAEMVSEVPLLVGNLYHDAHTAALRREHGIRSIVTRDTDFHRFGFIEVLDPLR